MEHPADSPQPIDPWLQALASLESDPVVVVDPRRRILALNAAAERLLRLENREAQGRSCTEVLRLVDEHGTEFCASGRCPLCSPGPLHPTEYAVLLERPAAPPVPCRLRTAFVTSRGGEVAGLAHLLTVVAEERDQEDELLRMVSRLSHELRTPLTSIKGCSSSLVRDFDRFSHQTKLDLVRIVDEQADRMRDLIDDLGDISRLAARALPLARQPVDLAVLVQQAVEEVQHRNGGDQFVVRLSIGLPTVEADPARVRQVLRCLLLNAVRASPAGTAITVEADAVEGAVRISVGDEGPSVAAEDAERIFTRFYQPRSPGSRTIGTGLGLAISRGIVEAHGGRIWVEPVGSGGNDTAITPAKAGEPTRGSTFRFTLPLEHHSAPAPALDHSRTPDPRPATRARRSTGRSSARVLVVDDEARIQRLLEANLRTSGYRVLLASDGRSAVELAAGESPDLVVLDILLPDMDGFEVCRRIREFSAVPIIILTVRDDDADKVRGLDLGADDYLTKPFEPKELLARIRASLRRAETPEDPRDQTVFAASDFSMDFAQRRVAVRGQEVKLSPTEYKLLYHLVSNAGRVLTHDELLRRVWGGDYGGETEYLWQYVRRLRQKVEADPRDPHYLLTEAGVGYRFVGGTQDTSSP